MGLWEEQQLWQWALAVGEGAGLSRPAPHEGQGALLNLIPENNETTLQQTQCPRRRTTFEAYETRSNDDVDNKATVAVFNKLHQ